ncbi:MAG: hypothetical protein U0325_31875 [Polyangiales bacterium]
MRGERDELLDGDALPGPVKTASMAMLHAANAALRSYPVWRDAIGVALRSAREPAWSTSRQAPGASGATWCDIPFRGAQ